MAVVSITSGRLTRGDRIALRFAALIQRAVATRIARRRTLLERRVHAADARARETIVDARDEHLARAYLLGVLR